MMALPSFEDVTILETVDSTNDAARRKIAEGTRTPFVIAAHQQNQGRGRSGRVWNTVSGNLAATYAVPIAGSYPEAARLGFAMSLAVRDTVAELTAGLPLAVKWPNDVLLCDKKVSGILLETAGSGPEGRLRLIIGIGVNLRHHPDPAEANWPPTSIAAQTGTPPEFDTALETLTRHVSSWLQTELTAGFDAVRSAWLSHAVRLGEHITVRLPDQTIDGIFRDVDGTGALILDTPGGIRTVTAGDVFFPELTRCS